MSLTGCVQTLDFYHACQHLSHCAERIFGEGTAQRSSSRTSTVAVCLLRQGLGRASASGWASCCAVEDEAERERRRQATDRLIGYFGKHTNRLNYAERLGAGRAIGSGQVEGKAKTLGLRLKARGARWNRRNVQPMASLVCVRHSSPMGSLLGLGRLITPRELGYTRPPRSSIVLFHHRRGQVIMQVGP